MQIKGGIFGEPGPEDSNGRALLKAITYVAVIAALMAGGAVVENYFKA